MRARPLHDWANPSWEQAFKRGKNACVDFLGRTESRNTGNTVRVVLGKRSESCGYSAMIGRGTPLDCVCCLSARSEPVSKSSFVCFEKDHPVRPQTVASEGVESGNGIVPQTPRSALIGPARIHKAVANDPIAAGQRGPDQVCDMVGAGGGEKEGFGLRCPPFPAGRVKQQIADCFGAGCAAWLAGNHYA